MLTAALEQVAAATARTRDPWWIIGSAAAALHGAPTTVADIDMLMSERDAAALLAAHGKAPAPGVPDGRFRSQVFGRVRLGGMAVEVMAGLAVFDGAGWRRIEPGTRLLVQGVFVPDRGELIAILHAFGLPKDLARAALLAPSSSPVRQ